MHIFIFTFCISCARRNLGLHTCRFEAVLKAKMLAFGCFLLSSLRFWGKTWFSAQPTAFGTPTSRKSVSGTLMFTTFWKVFYHDDKNFYGGTMRKWQGEETFSRLFSNFGIFVRFCNFQMVLSNSTGPALPFFGWKKLSPAPRDFKGPAVWASQADSFVALCETKRF